MKTLKFFVAAVAALMALACTQEEIDILTMGSSEVKVPYEGVEKTLEFTASTAWTIESDQDWVSFDQTEGVAGDVTVVMTVAANTTYENRTAVVTISAGDKFTEITLQQGLASEFGVEMEYNYDFMPQVLEVKVNANVEYQVSLSEGAEAWISSDALTKAAPVNESLVFNIALNSGADRTGEIKITAGENVQTIIINQAAFEGAVMSTVSAVYLGKTSWIYDHVNCTYPEFDEHFLSFANEAGDELTVSFNNEVLDSPLSGIPVGEYIADASGAHQAVTFTLNDSKTEYYTSAKVGGTLIDVVDGTVSVSVEGKTYKIIADLYDAAGISYGFAYIGEIPEIADMSFGADVLVEYKGQYDTYFTTKAKKMAVQFYISKKLPGMEHFIRYASVEFYVSEDSDHSVLSEGVYTLANPGTSAEVTYANGKLLAEAGMLTYVSLSDDKYGSYSVENGTVTVTKNDDGTYNFALDFDNLTGGYYDYDTDPNGKYVEISGFDYAAEFDDVKIGEIPFTGMEIALDVDAEFKMVSFGALQAMSFGDQWQTGGNVFVIQSNSINGVYSMSLFLHSDSAYEINNTPRKGYSTVPIPTATYTFSKTPQAGVNSILPAKYGATKCVVTNSYTGTVMSVSGGTVEYDGGTLTVDITATAGDVECKFTGTYSAGAPQAVRDMSTKTLTLVE